MDFLSFPIQNYVTLKKKSQSITFTNKTLIYENLMSEVT